MSIEKKGFFGLNNEGSSRKGFIDVPNEPVLPVNSEENIAVSDSDREKVLAGLENEYKDKLSAEMWDEIKNASANGASELKLRNIADMYLTRKAIREHGEELAKQADDLRK